MINPRLGTNFPGMTIKGQSSQTCRLKDCMCVKKSAELTFDYRPLVGYLTQTIDLCISGACQQKQDDIRRGEPSDLERMDSAILALENTIRLILEELEVRRARPDLPTETRPLTDNLDWLAAVFPDNRAGRELCARFYEIKAEA